MKLLGAINATVGCIYVVTVTFQQLSDNFTNWRFVVDQQDSQGARFNDCHVRGGNGLVAWIEHHPDGRAFAQATVY
jgi:hypothetical protein